jgi:outer membrane receptor protein involved in Fe transport
MFKPDKLRDAPCRTEPHRHRRHGRQRVAAVVGSWLVAVCAHAQAPSADGAAADPSTTLQDLQRVLTQPVYGDGRTAGASKYEQDLERAPAAVVIRTGGEIRAQGYRTLAEVLESMPGINIQYDRTYAYGGIRGISRPGDFTSRLLVLIDGARINDALYEGGPVGREFPLDVSLIDRVEFIAGPGSALYGSSAVLGVVNVITRTPSQLAGLKVSGEIGTSANRKAGATWGGELAGARVIFGLTSERRPGRDLYFPEFDTPENNGGIAHDADGESAGKMFVKARWSSLTVSAGLSEREKHIPTASYGVLFGAPNVWTDRYGFLNADYAERLDANQEISLRAGLERYRFRLRSVFGPRDDPSVSTEADAANAWSGEARYSWLGFADHRLTAGIEFQRNTRQSILLQSASPDAQVLTDFNVDSARYALYAADEWQLAPAWLLNAGLRADRRIDGQFTTSPRWAVIWTPNRQWTLKWTQGSAFREPNAFERLYADDTQRANPDLKVETLASRELVASWRPSEALTLESSLYAFRIRDVIELMTAGDGMNVFGNRGGLNSRGLDFTATYVWPHGAQLRASWSRQLATDQDTGEVLSGAPRSLVKLAWTIPGPLAGTLFGTNIRYVSSRLTRSGNRLGGYVHANAHLNYAPPGRPWSVAVGVYNLTGERHEDPVGPEHVQDAVAQDGREFRLQLGWAF